MFKLRARIQRPSPSMVVALFALVIALSGTAMAAKPLLDGADIADESLTGADIQNDTVTGADVDESSLSGIDAATLGNQLPAFFQDASNLSTGTLADARLSSNVTTDTEIFPNVLSNDGSGSTLDADSLDGKDSTDFLASTKMRGVSTTADFGDINAFSCAASSITIGGNVRDPVVVSARLLPQGLIASAEPVTAPDVFHPIPRILFRVCNITGVAIDPPGAEFFFVIFDTFPIG